MRQWFMLVLISLGMAFLLGATVELNDGTVIEGKIMLFNEEQVEIKKDDEFISIPRGAIASINYLNGLDENAIASQAEARGEKWLENPFLAKPLYEFRGVKGWEKKQQLVEPQRTMVSPSLEPSQAFPPLPIAEPEQSGLAPLSALGSAGMQTGALEEAPMPPGLPHAGTDEFRGIWVSRFEWPGGNAEQMKKRLEDMMKRLAEAHFNAVYLQVRGQGDVLYPSAIEPWSPRLGWQDPGFDPLEYAVTLAHAYGLELHAWINPFPVWQGETPPRQDLTPLHPYWRYCVGEGGINWLCFDRQRTPMVVDAKADKYLYVSPGIPAVHDYIRGIVREIVQNYDIDGIHLDRVRYPGPQYSHDPISRERFEGEGNPNGLGWEQWQAEQITRCLNNMYAEIQMLKPQVVLSCATWGIYDKTRIPGYSRFSSGLHDYYQDSWAWVERGVVDAIIPMIYWDMGGNKPDYDELLQHFLSNLPERHIYGGLGGSHILREDELQAEMEFTRSVGAPGVVIFSWGKVPRLQDFLRDQLFTQPAATPAMPWKAAALAVITGYVKDAQGKPLGDALITVSDEEWNWLSSADGFFGVPNLSPGQVYELSVSKQGYMESTMEIVPGFGEVKRVEVVLAPSQ